MGGLQTMTMPKKGLRKIVVGNRVYHYVIKPLSYESSHSNRLTIESTNGNKYYSKTTDDVITPAMVEEIIKENF
jgi:hypothetical protein